MSSTPVESASSAVIPAIGEVPVAQAGPVVNGDVIVAANEGDNTINTTQDSTTQADITQEDTTQAQDDTAQDSTTRDTSTQGTSTQGTSTQGTSTQGTTTQDTTTQADTTQAQDGATQDNNAQDNSSTDNHTVVSASTNNHTQLAGNATSGNVPMLVPGHALVQTSPAGPNIPPNPPQPSLPAQIVQDGTNNGPSKERFDYLKEKAIEVSKGRSRYARYVIKTIGLARWTRKHLKKMDACLEHLECRKLGSLTRMVCRSSNSSCTVFLVGPSCSFNRTRRIRTANLIPSFFCTDQRYGLDSY